MSDKKLKVLLVEDDQMIVEMYKLKLETDGFEVFVTDKGSEAIELAGKEKPDIILLDIILPEIDGFSILQEIKSDSATKKIPVMMLTNLSQESDQEKGTQMGAAGYFVKAQHTPADIMTEIKKILA
ncbi:MAG: response regulator [Candidatus Buchananbacteria bacterium]